MKTVSIGIQAVRPVVAAEVKYEIFKALERNAECDAGNICVEARGGDVILRGEVRSEAERDDAGRAARNTFGVTGVRNEIQVVSAPA
jgi:osmotically-inducible protein OsmY